MSFILRSRSKHLVDPSKQVFEQSASSAPYCLCLESSKEDSFLCYTVGDV
jgi:hypothetical protein